MQVFDFDNGIEASPGWSTGGGDPLTYAFTKNEGSTTSTGTGPSAGVGGSGPYVYAETSSPRAPGDLFTLTYDGSACSDTGLGVSTVTFYYHMYGATMGALNVTNAAGEVAWSLSGDQGDSWQATTVDIYSPSFAFEYTRGSSWQGDAAVALVAVSCGAGPPSPPHSPPSPPSPPAVPGKAGMCRDAQDSTSSDSWISWCPLPRDALPTVRASLTFSMEWMDQGWGGQKGQVALFADGARVYTTPRAQHTLTFFESGAIELAAGVNNLEFKYVVGSGGGHSITITNFAWSWSPLMPTLLPPPSPSLLQPSSPLPPPPSPLPLPSPLPPPSTKPPSQKSPPAAPPSPLACADKPKEKCSKKKCGKYKSQKKENCKKTCGLCDSSPPPPPPPDDKCAGKADIKTGRKKCKINKKKCNKGARSMQQCKKQCKNDKKKKKLCQKTCCDLGFAV